jgi:hypothetical protein
MGSGLFLDSRQEGNSTTSTIWSEHTTFSTIKIGEVRMMHMQLFLVVSKVLCI